MKVQKNRPLGTWELTRWLARPRAVGQCLGNTCWRQAPGHIRGRSGGSGTATGLHTLLRPRHLSECRFILVPHLAGLGSLRSPGGSIWMAAVPVTALRMLRSLSYLLHRRGSPDPSLSRPWGEVAIRLEFTREKTQRVHASLLAEASEPRCVLSCCLPHAAGSWAQVAAEAPFCRGSSAAQNLANHVECARFDAFGDGRGS